jgi:type I restriction enzyme S subunit
MSVIFGQPAVSTPVDTRIHWPRVALHELCERRSGVRDPRLSPDTPFRYVDITSVDRVSKTVVDARTMPGRDAPSRARKAIRAKDVIVSTTRPNLNAVALIPDELDDQIASTGFCVLRAGERLDPEYLFAYVRSPAFVGALSDLVVGALYPAVTDRQVMSQNIPLPPLPEQRRIAAALREQLDAAARMRAAAAPTRTGAAAAWKRTVELHLSAESLARYPARPLIDVCRRKGQYGTSVKSNRDGIGTPVLGMPNIGVGWVSWSPLSYVELEPRELEKYRLNSGDLLFNRTNSAELVGKTAVFREDREAVFASYLVRFVADQSIVVPEYLSYLTNSAIGRRFIESNMARAIGQVNISASAMHRFPVLLPPLREQKALVGQLDDCRRITDTVAGAAKQQAAEIGRLPAALLCKAFLDRD